MKTWERTLKVLIFTIFKLVFKLKQWPDFNGDDVKLMKDFRTYIDILQTTINLLSCFEKVNSVDVEKALIEQANILESKFIPDKDTLETWNNPLIMADLPDLLNSLFDDEVIDLIKELAEVDAEVENGKEIIKDYAWKLEKSIQDIKSIFRVKFSA